MVKPEWTRGNVKIPRSIIAEVERAGVAAYGRNEEACGYLEGPTSDPLRKTVARSQ